MLGTVKKYMDALEERLVETGGYNQVYTVSSAVEGNNCQGDVVWFSLRFLVLNIICSGLLIFSYLCLKIGLSCILALNHVLLLLFLLFIFLNKIRLTNYINKLFKNNIVRVHWIKTLMCISVYKFHSLHL